MKTSIVLVMAIALSGCSLMPGNYATTAKREDGGLPAYCSGC